MKLERLLIEERPAILKSWLQLILETYPADTQRFLKKQKDQFANPVRHTIATEIESIFRGILKGVDRERLTPSLDRIIRIRAVQDFTPSQAISFIFLLKVVIREKLGNDIYEKGLYEELSIFESKIDGLALLAFDIYMKRREKLYELTSNEAKNQVSRLLKKAGLISEVPKWNPNRKKGNRA